MSVVEEYSDEFLKYTYHCVCRYEPHSTKYIREIQKEMRKRNIDIPEVYCGYRSECGKMEVHPDNERNKQAFEMIKGKYIDKYV
jgi:hypothetical protein